MNLSHQSDNLSDGLQSFTELSNEAVAILDKLNTNLMGINRLTTPLYDQSTAFGNAVQNLSKTKDSVDQLLSKIENIHRVENALRRGPQADLDAYLANLSQLEDSLSCLQLHSSLRAAQDAYGHAEEVHRRAMEDCESVFKSTLSYHSTALLPSASLLTHEAQENLHVAVVKSQLESFPPDAIDRLQRLAGVMLSYSHMTCIDVYKEIRMRAIERSMQLVGLEHRSTLHSALQVQSPEQLEKSMRSWTLQLRVLLVLAGHEMELARAVWPKTKSDSVFGSVVPGPLEVLLKIGCSIADSRSNMHKVFVLLEMNRNLQDVLPLLGKLLGKKQGRCGKYISDMYGLQSQLGSSARSIFLEFEGSVGRDTSKVQVMDGTVHPLCAQTLSYLRRLFSYDDVELLIFSPPSGHGDMGSIPTAVTAAAIAAAGLDQGISPSHYAAVTNKGEAALWMAEAVGRVNTALLTNLEAKAGAYRSSSLAALFMMNNVHYMVWAVEQSDRLSFLWGSWLEHHKDIVERYGSQYHELTWMPLVQALLRIHSKEDAEPADQSRWCEWVKAKFRAFNTALEAIYAEQTAWTIPEPKLLSAVRRVILQDLVPPYDKFFRHFSVLDFSTHRSKYARYSPKDLRSMVENDLFEGRKMSLSKVAKATPTKRIH